MRRELTKGQLMGNKTMVQVVYNNENFRRLATTIYLHAENHVKAWDKVQGFLGGWEIVDVYITDNPLYFTEKEDA